LLHFSSTRLTQSKNWPAR